LGRQDQQDHQDRAAFGHKEGQGRKLKAQRNNFRKISKSILKAQARLAAGEKIPSIL
jgi:hypothetical protein